MQKMIDELSLYPAQDAIPNQLAEKVVPVFQVNSESITFSATPANVVRNVDIEFDGGTTNTIYAVPATGKFYLVGFNISMSNGKVGYNSAKINVTIDGTARSIGQIQVSPRNATAGDVQTWCDSLSLSLANPILIDKSTNITLVTEDDDCHASAAIYGYTE